MNKQKEARKERTIKGEVEGYSREITPFPGGRGSRGIKVEGEWHNMIGSKDFLKLLEETYPVGSFVVFAEKQNRKKYWDFIEATLKKITKEEAYSKEIQDNIATENLQNSAYPPESVGVQHNKPEEETVRELTQDDIDLLKKEIKTMEAKVLQKEHENIKLRHNFKNIKQALKYSISNQKNIILSAEGILEDLEYDLENNVTLTGTENKIDENKTEITRLENNIKVRNKEIVNATPDRNEKARINIHGPI